MILTYSQLVGKPIVELQNQTKIGKVIDLLINKESLTLPAIIMSPGFFSRENKLIANIDIIQTVRDGILVNNEEAAMDFRDAIRLSGLIKEKSYGVGQEVYITGSNEYLGKVYDFQFESNCLSITKLMVKKGFLERTIPANQIKNFSGNKIYVKESMKSSYIKKAVLETTSAS